MVSLSSMHPDDLVVDITVNKKIKAGIYVFKGCTNFRGIGVVASLTLHTDDGCKHVPVFLNSSGRFFEIFTVPQMTKFITLSIKANEHSSSSLQLQSMSLKRILWIQRRVIFQYIAWSTWYRFTKSQRHHHQLFWYTPFFSSVTAYACVQQYRFKHGTVSYDEWLEQVDLLSPSETQLIKHFSDRLSKQVSVKPIILIDARLSSPLALAATIESLQDSLFRPHSLVILHHTEQSIQLPKTDALLPVVPMTLDELTQHVASQVDHYWVYIPAGARLAPQALSWLTASISEDPSLTCIYTDHDSLDEQGKRVEPQFKPDWSEEMALASGYPGALLCVSSQSLLDTLKKTHDLSSYALMLYAACQRHSSVKHIPSILWHFPSALQKSHYPSSTHLQLFLQGQGREAQVSQDPATKGLRVHYPIPHPAPLVSIIIPTRDRLDLLQPCLNSILSLTTYPNFEVLVLDNQSQEPDTLNYFVRLTSEPRVKVVSFDHPFNYAAINNYAVSHAQGSVLCLLNNDTEVVTPDWLDEMISCLYVQGVGAVGAQLRYPNGRLQHAGDLIGGSGCANHLYGPLEPGDFGYMNRVALRQDLSAVTAACLVTFKELYQSIGGMDQHNLRVAFNDVDYCLKVRESGYRVLYTPYAQLIHYESESRGADITAKQRRRGFKEAQYMRKRWADIMMNDPFYNPNLNYYRCDFSLDPAPMIMKPWD